MEIALAFLVLVGLIALLVLAPLRHPGGDDRRDDERRASLEAAKEAKYREIHDAELDHRMGKLSQEDWRELDRELRAQAIGILQEIDRLDGREPPGPRSG